MFDLVSYRHSGSHFDMAAALRLLAEDTEARCYLCRDGNFSVLEDVLLPQRNALGPGDAVLVCSRAFWSCMSELEFRIDRLKSNSARAWLNYLLVRLAQKTRLELSDFAVLCGIQSEEGATPP